MPTKCPICDTPNGLCCMYMDGNQPAPKLTPDQREAVEWAQREAEAYNTHGGMYPARAAALQSLLENK